MGRGGGRHGIRWEVVDECIGTHNHVQKEGDAIHRLCTQVPGLVTF